MEHAEALTTNATERYLLGEMPESERDRFEEHFFDCTDCASDVRDGARMMAAGREVAAETANVRSISSSPKWMKWIPQAAAAAVIGGSVGWFGALNYAPRLAATADVPAVVEVVHYELPTDTVRAGATEVLEVRAGEGVVLDFAIPDSEEAASYVYTLRDEKGRVFISKAVSLDDALDRVELSLRGLPRGSHELVIEGVRKTDGNRFPITTQRFRVV